MKPLGNSWDKYFELETKKEYYLNLREFLKEEYSTKEIFPPKEEIFTAFKLTPYDNVKIVILGQDPYHDNNQAHGLAFSVKPNIKTPPSLLNIYKEINASTGLYIPNNGYLVSWAEQGILLLNTVLTVQAHQANSHKNKGWETFTDAMITYLNMRNEPIIFMLWGTPARKKKDLITNANHFILEAPHPSPLSAHRGFFGCNHFNKANEILEQIGKPPINWQIPNL
ncbi:MAG: uracil-DNA glycosylase [Epulopiscium sp. Nele67-Bin005]|nr:MAG: uracil-DNA glycosylase [Epulopiscium sp. Nele67-Bin005]